MTQQDPAGRAVRRTATPGWPDGSCPSPTPWSTTSTSSTSSTISSSRCVELLEVTAAGLLLVDLRGELQPVAASTRPPRILEVLQLQTAEGPCVDCVRTGKPSRCRTSRRCGTAGPGSPRAVAESGFVSVHAAPMRLRRETIGSLNLFSATPPPLSANEQRIAQALADVATIGILQ